MPDWTDIGGVNEGYVLELYERSCRIRSRSMRARARCSRSGRRSWAVPSTGRAAPPGAPAADDRRGAADLRNDRGRRQPGRVDSALRAPGRAARPARYAAVRGSVACARGARHHRGRTCASCPRRSSADPWLSARRTPPRPSKGCAASTARAPATTSRTSSVPEEREWLRHAAEAGLFRAPAEPVERLGAARSHHRGRDLRALPAPHLPGQDPVLGRRPGHARPDPRRDHRRLGRRGRAARAHRHGPSRAPQRARPRAAEGVRADPARVQGRAAASSRSARISAGPAT